MRKATGIVRRVDELGRIVIPIELRRTLGIGEKDSVEIFVDDEQIVLRKYEPACIFTGEVSHVINYKGKNVSLTAIAEMAQIAGLIPAEAAAAKAPAILSNQERDA